MSLAPAPAPTSSGLLTAPNLITFVRLCCIPLFVWLLFSRDNRLAASLVLGGLGATDWVDGFVARRFNQVSEFGKVFDPTVDRLLFVVGITSLIIDNSAPRWFCVLVLVREVFIAVAMAGLTLLGMKRFDVTYLGKWATFLLMFAFPLFLLHAAQRGYWSKGALVLAWACGIPGLVLSYYTALKYIPKMRENLRAGRRERVRTSG